MTGYLRWGIGVTVLALLVGCSDSERGEPTSSSVVAAALPGDLTYQDVLEKGETVHNLAMTPDTGRIWVGTHAGLYSSADGGMWGLVSPQLEQQDITGWFVDPQDTQRIIAAGSEGVWRSQDGGKTWSSIGKGLPTPANIRSFAGIREGEQIRLFAFVSGEGIYQSVDGGMNWSLWQPMDQEVYAMDFNPEENRLYVAAQFSLFYNEDGEWKTEPLPQAQQIYSLSVDRRTGVLAAATEQGIFEKVDGEWRLLDARAPEKLIVIAQGAGDAKWVGIGESALIYKLTRERWTKWN